MAEHDDEREASQAYRQLPREEPPASLDARIRAEARTALETHPAPLVPPTARRRWYFPVAAAAVIVLAVAVTWQIEREQPDPMIAMAPRVKEEAQPRAVEEKKPEQQEGFRSDLRRRGEPPAPRREITRERMDRSDAVAPASPSAAAPPQASSGALSARPEVQAETRAKALMKQVSPEAELERIAELRRQGKDEEADRALAEFRKRYPDYRIAPEMLKKVEKKK